MIIGITGKKRSGKDTVASMLVEGAGFRRVGFSDSLKDLAYRINPLVEGWADGSYDRPMERYRDVVDRLGLERAKEYTDPRDGYDIRRFLQELGTQARNVLGEDLWTDDWARRVLDTIPAGAGLEEVNIVVPDVRFKNEAEEIRAWGGRIWRVHRPGLPLTDTHVSETEMDEIAVDLTINNSSYLSSFLASAPRICEAALNAHSPTLRGTS